MSLLVPCGYCGSREPGKNAWLVWAWLRADGVRVAYRQRLCITCCQTNVVPLLANLLANPLSCPGCHVDALEQMDPIYLTYIFPGSGKEQAEMPTCGPCAVEIRIRAQTGGELLADRQPGVGAAAPTRSATSAWDALGLRPDGDAA